MREFWNGISIINLQGVKVKLFWFENPNFVYFYILHDKNKIKMQIFYINIKYITIFQIKKEI